MVLGDHVDVLRQGTVSDETRPFLYAGQQSAKPASLNGKLVRVQGSKGGSGVCLPDVGCAGQTEEQEPSDRRGDCSKNSGTGSEEHDCCVRHASYQTQKTSR